MKKLFSIIALILAAMLPFSACNEGNTPVDSDTNADLSGLRIYVPVAN